MGTEALVVKQQGQRHPRPAAVSARLPSPGPGATSEERLRGAGCSWESGGSPAAGADASSWGLRFPRPTSLLVFPLLLPTTSEPFCLCVSVAPKSAASRVLPHAHLPGLPCRHGDGGSARAPTTFAHPALYTASLQRPRYTNP